jgi:quercetin dioxygenase-like cupin family protein
MQRVNERDCEFRGGNWGVKYLMRGPKLDWGIILLRSGQVIGEHGHKEVEETFYVLEGTPTLIVDGKPIPTARGDVFRLVPPERHDIRNDGPAHAKVIFIKTPFLPHDKT